MIIQGKIRILLLVAFLVMPFFAAKDAAAIATSTVRGKAWWGATNSFIYFDCLDDEIGDHLGDVYNLCGRVDDLQGNFLYCASFPNNGFHFYSVPCTTIVHHVYMDTYGRISGSAWSPVKGLISFDAADTPPEGGRSYNSKCYHCNASNPCLACYNETDQKLYGWAKAEDGTWLQFDTATTSPPVQIKNWDKVSVSKQLLPGHGIQPGDFVGYALSGTDNHGFQATSTISFNCQNEYNGFGDCTAPGYYKVYLSDLQLAHMSAPNWGPSEACTLGAIGAVLKWYVMSGTSSGFELVVNDANHFSTSTGDYVCWSGTSSASSSAVQYRLSSPTRPNSDPTCHPLAYGRNYYWWIRLFNASGIATPWYQFGVDDGHIGTLDEATDGNPDNATSTFTTYAHEFPNPYFTWLPTNILVATNTAFTSNYASGSPAPINSYGPYSYLWSTSDGRDLITSQYAATTSINFYKVGDHTITLTATDAAPYNYSCSTTTLPVTVNYDLPIWREVKVKQY